MNTYAFSRVKRVIYPISIAVIVILLALTTQVEGKNLKPEAPQPPPLTSWFGEASRIDEESCYLDRSKPIHQNLICKKNSENSNLLDRFSRFETPNPSWSF